MDVLVTVAIVLALLLLAAAIGYNGLVRRRNRTSEAWSQIDVELKRRHDLIPNLVATVQGYASHERTTLDAVTAARAAAVTAGTSHDPTAVASAESGLNASLRSLFAVAENYPALRAQEGFLALQEELTATEDKLEYARRYYNTSVRDYNSAVQSLPRSLLAKPLRFHPFAYFQADAPDRGHPDRRVHHAGTPPGLGPAMYEQIAANKRRTIIYVGLFVVTWLAIGAAIGAILDASTPRGPDGFRGPAGCACRHGDRGVGRDGRCPCRAAFRCPTRPRGRRSPAGGPAPIPAAAQPGRGAGDRRRPADPGRLHRR